jgi:predicted transcriptional regulator|tara:strand:+ start:289 stop:456 length:168 start_codon:yes stop_codon:yes gene_type:complete
MNYSSKTNKYSKLKKSTTKAKRWYAGVLRFFGVSVKDIARRLNVTPARVYQYLKK